MRNISDRINGLLSISGAVWLLYETIIAYRQLFGIVPSNNPLFTITGSFNNPGPFGGFVAVLLSISIVFAISLFEKKDRNRLEWALLISTSASSIAALVILPSSGSRTALISIAISAFCFILVNWEKLRLNISKRNFVVITLSVFFLSAVGLFLMKPDSAIGRFHIWNIECRVIADNPVKGVGDGQALGAYGIEQAEYFKEIERPEVLKRVAGCPEYAFNEYLRTGMERGLPCMAVQILATIFVILVLLKRNSPLAYGAITLTVFAFASYPFSLWQFRAIALALLCAGIINIPIDVRGQMTALAVTVAIAIITFSRGGIKDEEQTYRQMYEQGYDLFEYGSYPEAIKILEEGAQISSDPMFHNIIGRCHEALGEYDAAEREYILSHFMVPGRLYPLVLLKEMYEKTGKVEESEKVMGEILSIPINPKNSNMSKLLERAKYGEQ